MLSSFTDAQDDIQFSLFDGAVNGMEAYTAIVKNYSFDHTKKPSTW
ncbi:hypothetical protein [Desulfotomaculum sp. 1211_IL3151]